MRDDFTWRCRLCDAPTNDNLLGLFDRSAFGEHEPVHRACWDAWATSDREALDRLRKQACAAGHHRSPGRWTKDPADPYGDAAFWECTKGCGHVQRHPGYGHKRAVAEMLALEAAEAAE